MFVKKSFLYYCVRVLRVGVMVARRPLEAKIGVRAPDPQPIKYGKVFLKREGFKNPRAPLGLDGEVLLYYHALRLYPFMCRRDALCWVH